jgi:hypothetical protein
MDSVLRLHARLAVAGVAEPSTLVMEFDGDPVRSANRPRTAMSSRIARPNIRGAAFHEAGLTEGYCTYELPVILADPLPDVVLSPLELLALGLRRAVEHIGEQGVPVRRFVATGKTTACGSIDRDVVQVFADVLAERIVVRPCREVEQRGAEILAALRRPHRFASFSQALKHLADRDEAYGVRRDLSASRRYADL